MPALITPISLERLGSELLEDLKPTRSLKGTYLPTRQALKILEAMGVRASDELVLNQEFVGRFLDTWGGSIRTVTIRTMLCNLRRIRDFAAQKSYLEPSESDRFTPLPPEWDHRHFHFTQNCRVLPPHPSRREYPVLSWEDFLLLVEQLKAESRTWTGTRLFMMVALILLARLSSTEAAALRRIDIEWMGPERRMRVANRDRFQSRRGAAVIPIVGPLVTLLDRWSSRCGPEFLLPSNDRKRPWSFNDKWTANHQIAEACHKAGIPTVTLADLKRFGKVNTGRLMGDRESPFQLDDGVCGLASNESPIWQFRDAVSGHYDPSQYESLRLVNVIFDAIEAMPGIATTRNMENPDFVARLAAQMGIEDPARKPHHFLMVRLHAITDMGMELGYLNADPFSGHSYAVKLKWVRKTPVRRNDPLENRPLPPVVELALRSSGNQKPWSTPPKVKGLEKTALTQKQYDVVLELLDAGPDGLTWAALRSGSGVPGCRTILETLKKSDPDWDAVIHFPGRGGIGSWIS